MDLTKCHKCLWNQYELCDWLKNPHRRPDEEVCPTYHRRTALYYTGPTMMIKTPACSSCGHIEFTSVPQHIAHALTDRIGKAPEVLTIFGTSFIEHFVNGICSKCQNVSYSALWRK